MINYETIAWVRCYFFYADRTRLYLTIKLSIKLLEAQAIGLLNRTYAIEWIKGQKAMDFR
jgi:hypothetical protein